MSLNDRNPSSNIHPLLHAKRQRVMQKEYYLVNLRTGERLIVKAPRGPGINEDWQNPMNEKGEYIRIFRIINFNNIKVFTRPAIAMFHMPGTLPRTTDSVNGDIWAVQEIPGIRAPKPRTKISLIPAEQVSFATATRSESSVKKTGDTGIFTVS